MIPASMVVAGVLLLVSAGLSSMNTARSTPIGVHERTVETWRGPGLPFWTGVGMLVMGSAMFLTPRRTPQRAT